MGDHSTEREQERRERRTLSIQQAADQNFEYFGLVSGERIDLEDGEPLLEIPHPEYLLPEQQRRISELRVKFSKYERSSNGEYLDDGKVVDPPYDVQLCIALWNEHDYKRFEAAGGRPGLVQIVWARMNAQFAERRRADPK